MGPVAEAIGKCLTKEGDSISFSAMFPGTNGVSVNTVNDDGEGIIIFVPFHNIDVLIHKGQVREDEEGKRWYS